MSASRLFQFPIRRQSVWEFLVWIGQKQRTDPTTEAAEDAENYWKFLRPACPVGAHLSVGQAAGLLHAPTPGEGRAFQTISRVVRAHAVNHHG